MTPGATEKDNPDGETVLTRRDAITGGAGLAAAALVSKFISNPARAQTVDEPRIQLGEDWDIDDVVQGDGDTDLVFRHRPTGATVAYDGVDDVFRLSEIETEALSGSVTGGNRVTNLFGQGLEFASGAVQLLSSIWDGTSIVADVDNQSVNTETLVSDRHYSGSYVGSDVDSRLGNALAAASDGQTIYLEKGISTNDRTIAKRVKFVGSGGGQTLGTNGTLVSSATWTLSGRVAIQDVVFDGSISISSDRCSLRTVGLATVTISGDGCGVFESNAVSVTFESGTSDGIADSLFGGSTVTDSGSNTIGDIA